MAVTAHLRGWPCEYVRGWRQADGEQIAEDRECRRCGRKPTPEGYDACLGHIPGAKHACCGHGVKEGYIIYEDGTRVSLGVKSSRST